MDEIIIANWKMQLSLMESVQLAQNIKELLAQEKLSAKKKVVLCPDFEAISSVAEILANTGIALGAQDGFYEDKGAFTGQVSLKQLRELGCDYVILGHSEKRAMGESDQNINRKVRKALALGLTPIICVGETFEQRQQGNKGEIIMQQVYKALHEVFPEPGHNIIIAYEPVWVIGSGQAISGQEAAQTALMIKQSYVDMMEGENLEALRIIYGGSVDSENIKNFTGQPNIGGALVGGASLKALDFVAVIKNS